MKPADNTIYIGSKPTMNYVLAAVSQFNSGCPEVTLKARGRAISKAVDVAEIIRHRFVPDATVKNVDIGTETVSTHDGGSTNVSSIEIVLQS
ncbi:MAG: DNA-binding protein Alba [Candidatus Methanomethylophilaceae archaeon]|jgi:DNA-binding protein